MDDETVTHAAVAVRDLRKRYGGRVVIPGLGFEIGEGEIFAILGPNGAGKSTTIHLMLGLLRRGRGEVRLLGFDPERQPMEVRRRVGLVPQETNLYDDLSALDNLWHHAALYCGDLGAVSGRIDELLRLMALWDRRMDPPKAYSGGMKRRLALARALLHDPAVILFDEPTLGVDVQGRHVLWDHVRSLRDLGKTVIVSTNDMAEADALCDRLLVVDRGRRVALDTPNALKASLGRDIVTVRTDPAIENPEALLQPFGVDDASRPEPDVLRFEVSDAEARVGEMIQRITAAHRLEWVRVARPTLDDVFLALTGRELREKGL
jgi:ABC-type multidrug transport system ATPase subunit